MEVALLALFEPTAMSLKESSMVTVVALVFLLTLPAVPEVIKIQISQRMDNTMKRIFLMLKGKQ